MSIRFKAGPRRARPRFRIHTGLITIGVAALAFALIRGLWAIGALGVFFYLVVFGYGAVWLGIILGLPAGVAVVWWAGALRGAYALALYPWIVLGALYVPWLLARDVGGGQPGWSLGETMGTPLGPAVDGIVNASHLSLLVAAYFVAPMSVVVSLGMLPDLVAPRGRRRAPMLLAILLLALGWLVLVELWTGDPGGAIRWTVRRWSLPPL